jgi:hypothetical protein
LPITRKVVDVVFWTRELAIEDRSQKRNKREKCIHFASDPFQEFSLRRGTTFDLKMVFDNDKPDEIQKNSSITITQCRTIKITALFDTFFLQKIEELSHILKVLGSHHWSFNKYNFLQRNDFE